MILSEEEARKRICHRSLGKGGPDKIMVCAASECMAWRWADLDELIGFCGLAGQAQHTHESLIYSGGIDVDNQT